MPWQFSNIQVLNFVRLNFQHDLEHWKDVPLFPFTARRGLRNQRRDEGKHRERNSTSARIEDLISNICVGISLPLSSVCYKSAAM
jgi:hypothetical protein